MALTERLAIIITANGAQAMGEFQKVGRNAERSLQTVEQRSQRIGQGLTRAGAAMVGFGAVMATGMFMAARAAEEQNRAELELANTISNIPALAGASTGAFLDQADALMQVTVADDAAIVSMQAMLGTFHLTQDEILTATPLVVDYARKFGVDLVTAAKQVGKALSGNIGTLQRNGVMIDENAYATDRFSAVMDALRENAGGFAEAEGATFSGQLEIMKNRLGEVAEGVGVGAVDAFSNLLGAVEGVTGAFDSAGAGGQAFLGQLLTYGSVGSIAVGALSLVAGTLVRFAGVAKGAADAAYMMYLRVRTSPMSFQQMAVRAGAATGALAVLALAFQRYQDQQSTAASRQQSLETAFSENADAVDAYSEALATLDQSDAAAGGAELQRAMAEAGISIEDLVAAADAGGETLDALIQRIADSGEVSDDVRSSWEQLGQAIAGDLEGEHDYSALTRAEQGIMDIIEASREAQEIDAASDAITDVGGAASYSAEELQALSDAMDEFFNQTFGVQRAVDNVTVAQQRLFESLLENGPVMEGNSAAALANRGAYDEFSTSIGAATDAIIANGEGAGAAVSFIEAQRTALADAAAQGLISSDTFAHFSSILDGLLTVVRVETQTPGIQTATERTAHFDRIIDGIPSYRSTQFIANTEGAEAKVRAYLRLIDQADSRRFTMQVSVPNGPSSWSGGPVPGGSGQAVGMTLHGGEYVLSEDVVDKIKRGKRSRGADMSASTGGAGGTVYNIEVNGAVGPPDEIARKMMAEIRKLEKAVAA